MINKFIIPIILFLILIVVQLVLIPLISIGGVAPNIVLVYLIFYSLKNGQKLGMLFGFFIGFMFDIASGGLIGSGMFAFTLATFIAGYFSKEDFTETIQNIKSYLVVVSISAIVFFTLYSVLGSMDVAILTKHNFVVSVLLSSAYTVLISQAIYLIPRFRL
jgi:rod shape-determining protein MreD